MRSDEIRCEMMKYNHMITPSFNSFGTWSAFVVTTCFWLWFNSFGTWSALWLPLVFGWDMKLFCSLCGYHLFSLCDYHLFFISLCGYHLFLAEVWSYFCNLCGYHLFLELWDKISLCGYHLFLISLCGYHFFLAEIWSYFSALVVTTCFWLRFGTWSAFVVTTCFWLRYEAIFQPLWLPLVFGWASLCGYHLFLAEIWSYFSAFVVTTCFFQPLWLPLVFGWASLCG